MPSVKTTPPTKKRNRCDWANGDALYEQYHDEEWGVPCFDDHKLFEFLILEGAQAGLSWITILRKRENYRRAFANFEAQKVARFNRRSIARLMNDAGIVRNRLKIEAAISNAKLFLDLQESHGSFSHYLWRFLDSQSIQNHWSNLSECPATAPVSDAISKDMKKKAFVFLARPIVTPICRPWVWLTIMKPVVFATASVRR